MAVRRSEILVSQSTLRRHLAVSGLPVTGAVQMLLNAVFVDVSPDQVPSLQALPGVRFVVPLRMHHRHLDRAAQLVGAPAAWNALGGAANAGRGIKIGIIDTGIDQNHPGFLDPALPDQPRLCTGDDCAFTNNKVIAARSYVRQLGAGSGPEPAANSRPDDFSPRDRDGHGTAVAMVAAGITNTGPNGTITGIAPKAYLGNYKVYGTNGINDGATEDVIIRALEDAFNDGMDVVNLSSGAPAFSGPLDTGAVCGNPQGQPCDLLASTFDAATRRGMVVVVSAGNEGSAGLFAPTAATVSSPSTAPGAISVAASTNSHTFINGIFVSGNRVPSPLTSIAVEFSDGPTPEGSLTAQLTDAASTGDAYACHPLPAGSLSGKIAIVVRSPDCPFSTKVKNAQSAGAIAVVFTLADANETLIAPGGLTETSIPSLVISQPDGQLLRSYVNANPSATATLDQTFLVARDSVPDRIAAFSSRGPALNGREVKPELTGVGTDMFMAAERVDSTGNLYSSNGYTAASGTSFSSPMVAGAAALVKQRHPSFNPAQIKSALLNTSTANILMESGRLAPVSAQGAGKLDVAEAIDATVTFSPPTVYFGLLTPANLPEPVPIQAYNGGSAAVTLTATAPAPLSISNSTFTITPGQTATFTLSLPSTFQTGGTYSGQVAFAGSSVGLHLPYSYVVGDGIPANAVALAGFGSTGIVGMAVPDGILALQLTDRFGAPVSGFPVRFTSVRGGGSVSPSDTVTNVYGIAYVQATLGPNPGSNVYVGQAAGLSVQFQNTGRLQPTISSNGIVDAASSALNRGIVPGSYITLYGSALSDFTAVATSATLPLALSGVSVSFDTPTLSLPGYLYFVSASQVNLQVPWELAGQTAVQIKVSVGPVSGNVLTVPVVSASPALFVYGASQAAALDSDGLLIGTSSPARRGQIISLFGNALGPVFPRPASGDPASSLPLSQSTTEPVVTVGGIPATVLFSGLAPGFTGLYQINVRVPETVPTGSVPVTIATGAALSAAAQIAIQ